MLRVPSNERFLNSNSTNAGIGNNTVRSSIGSDRSSTSTVGSTRSGDPTVASLGVRHLSPAVSVVTSSASSTLMTRSVFVESLSHGGKNNGDFLITPINKTAALTGTSSSLSSGTGTTSPVSSSSPRLSTCSSTLALNENMPMSTADRIIRELVDTETAYVRDLEDVIIGYIVPLRIERILPESDIECIFSNVEEIYYLNKRLLMRMQKAVDRSSGSPSLSVISRCFSDKSNCEKLVNTYSRYCASFATSSTRLESIQHNQNYANVTRHIRDLQVSLGHSLPLFAYLLKPVQRILKYQLLWQKLAEQFDVSTPEHGMALDAAISMIHIAQLINSCISLPNSSSSQSQSTIGESAPIPKASTWRSPNTAMTTSAILPTFSSSANLKYAREKIPPSENFAKPSPVPGGQPSFVRVIVMQGQLQMRGAKHPRHVVLFDSSLVVYKVHRMWRKSQEQEQLIHQITIPAASLKLCEVTTEKATNLASFTVEAVLEPKSSHIFQADSVEKKQAWCDAIRNVIISAANPTPLMQKQRIGTDSVKRHTLGTQMTSSVIVVVNNNNNGSNKNMNNNSHHPQPLNPRRSASPFVGLVESSSNSTASAGTTIGVLEQHRHRRLGTTKSHESALSPQPRFSSVGSSITGANNNDIQEAAYRGAAEKATTDDQARKAAAVIGDEGVSPTHWLSDPHQTINRTDSEKWRERNRWKCSKSATIDRYCLSGPNNEHRTKVEDVFRFARGAKTEHQKMRGLVPRRAFVRRPSFVCDSHLLRVAQQRRSISSDDKTPTPVPQETPTLPSDVHQHRYSRSNGLRRFFDAVAKRFRSSDRTSKSFVYASGTDLEVNVKQDLPSLSASVSATTSELVQQAAVTPVPERCQSPPVPCDDTSDLKPQKNVKTIERVFGLNGIQPAVSKQISCSALLFTPRHSSLTSQQRQAAGKVVFKKKSEVRTAKIAHWAASGVPRDVFV